MVSPVACLPTSNWAHKEEFWIIFASCVEPFQCVTMLENCTVGVQTPYTFIDKHFLQFLYTSASSVANFSRDVAIFIELDLVGATASGNLMSSFLSSHIVLRTLHYFADNWFTHTTQVCCYTMEGSTCQNLKVMSTCKGGGTGLPLTESHESFDWTKQMISAALLLYIKKRSWKFVSSKSFSGLLSVFLDLVLVFQHHWCSQCGPFSPCEVRHLYSEDKPLARFYSSLHLVLD